LDPSRYSHGRAAPNRYNLVAIDQKDTVASAGPSDLITTSSGLPAAAASAK
jgi:hypothetical protein